jgi:hypothetical protein
VQRQHWQNDSRFALAHIELHDGTRIGHQVLCNVVLRRAYLQAALHLKDEPLGVDGRIPGTVHLQLLQQQQQQQWQWQQWRWWQQQV